MGLIRGGLLVVASVLLFVGFLLMNSLLVVSNSLEYENIQEGLVPVIEEVVGEKIDLSVIVDDKFGMMQEYCVVNNNFVFSEGDYTFDISCESILAGSDAVLEEIVNEFVEEIYYQDYDCEFIDCFEEQKELPYFLVSEKTQNYFEGKFYLVLLICFALAVLMFFFIGSKTNLLILVGSLLVLSSLPFLKLESFTGLFAGKEMLQFFTFLFTQSYAVFIKILIVGIILIAIGIFLKFFSWGFKISEFIQKIIPKFSQGSKKEKVSKKKQVKEQPVVKDKKALGKKSK